MSNPLVLLPFLEEQNPKYSSFIRRTTLTGLTAQAAKTNFQVLQSITGKGYLDRAFLNLYWVFYNGNWLRFRIVADGVVIYDHLVDSNMQNNVSEASLGIAQTKYLHGDVSNVGQELFVHPIYMGNGSNIGRAAIRNVSTLQIGLPPAITSVTGYADAWGLTPITEPIYFNSSLSIEVSMASGSSVGAGALVISGGLI